MSKTLSIVYEEDSTEHRGACLQFKDEEANIVEAALDTAEAKGALGCHFAINDNKTFNLRTDKYLYWQVTVSEL